MFCKLSRKGKVMVVPWRFEKIVKYCLPCSMDSYLNFFLSRKVTTWTLPKRSIKVILSDEKCVRKYIFSIK